MNSHVTAARKATTRTSTEGLKGAAQRRTTITGVTIDPNLSMSREVAHDWAGEQLTHSGRSAPASGRGLARRRDQRSWRAGLASSTLSMPRMRSIRASSSSAKENEPPAFVRGRSRQEAHRNSLLARSSVGLPARDDRLERVGEAVPDLAEDGERRRSVSLHHGRQYAEQPQARVGRRLDVLDHLEGLANRAAGQALGLEGEENEIGSGEGGRRHAAQARRRVDHHELGVGLGLAERPVEGASVRKLRFVGRHVGGVEPAPRQQAEAGELG